MAHIHASLTNFATHAVARTFGPDPVFPVAVPLAPATFFPAFMRRRFAVGYTTVPDLRYLLFCKYHYGYFTVLMWV